MGAPAAGISGRGAALSAPLLLLAMALGVLLLFAVALNAILDGLPSGPAAGVRDATFAARGDGAQYEPGPSVTFARQRPLVAGSQTGGS